MLDRNRSRNRSKTGDPFSPVGLFVSGAQGAWYDPSDFSTLYQNSTGTTPVTAVEQPVGLMLDRSRGLVLGSELVTNGAGDSTTGWSTSGSVGSFTSTGGKLRLTSNGAVAYATQALTTVVGRLYIVNCEFVDVVIPTGVFRGIRKADDTAATVNVVNFANSSSSSPTSGSGAFNFVATATTSYVILQVNGNATSVDFDNISVRELPGNHALQATSASRPVLRARYNLMTYSEQFDNAAWTKGGTTVTANSTTAPDGTTTADTLTEDTSTGDHRTFQLVSLAAAAYTFSVYLKPNGRSLVALTLAAIGDATFDISSGVVTSTTLGTASITADANGWFRCALQFTGTATSYNAQIRLVSTGTTTSYTGDGVSGVFIRGAQLLPAADQTSTGGAYQRIAAATDYDTTNPVFRPYLAFDGVDDFMSLASAISITTDMTVVRGFGRSAAGIQSAGLGTSSAAAPAEMAWNTSNDIVIGRLGTPEATVTSANTTTGHYVSTNRRDATNEIGRLNGTQILTRASITLAGTLTDLGRRQTGTVYNSGPIYGLIVLDRALTGSELTATEQWMAGKTGVTL